MKSGNKIDGDHNMSNHSFEEVGRMDQALQNLALYDVAHGLIFVPHSIDEAMAFQTKVAEKFNYFKRLIQNRECTFDFIRNEVLSKNGPFPKGPAIAPDKMIDQIEKWAQEESEVENNTPQGYITEFLDRLLPDMSKSDKDRLVKNTGLEVVFMGSSKPPEKKQKMPLEKSSKKSSFVSRKKPRKNNGKKSRNGGDMGSGSSPDAPQ